MTDEVSFEGAPVPQPPRRSRFLQIAVGVGMLATAAAMVVVYNERDSINGWFGFDGSSQTAPEAVGSAPAADSGPSQRIKDLEAQIEALTFERDLRVLNDHTTYTRVKPFSEISGLRFTQQNQGDASKAVTFETMQGRTFDYRLHVGHVGRIEERLAYLDVPPLLRAHGVKSIANPELNASGVAARYDPGNDFVSTAMRLGMDNPDATPIEKITYALSWVGKTVPLDPQVADVQHLHTAAFYGIGSDATRSVAAWSALAAAGFPSGIAISCDDTVYTSPPGVAVAQPGNQLLVTPLVGFAENDAGKMKEGLHYSHDGVLYFPVDLATPEIRRVPQDRVGKDTRIFYAPLKVK